MKFASTGGAGSGNACFYFEVRRASTGAVLGTYGSSGSPVACSTGATQTVSTTDISAQVTNTTIANDLRIRVLGVETGAKAWKVESATVTGATTLGNYTLYPNTLVDSADRHSGEHRVGPGHRRRRRDLPDPGLAHGLQHGPAAHAHLPRRDPGRRDHHLGELHPLLQVRDRRATTPAGTSRSTTARR